MCAGEIDFKPYIPIQLLEGLDSGTYKIQYVSGAIRSHNHLRFTSFIPQFNLKWNKYYTLQENNITEFQRFNYKNFPELKFNVLQCQFGTLPGFTTLGTNTKQLANLFSLGKNLPQEVLQLIQDDIKPLEFTIDTKTPISFWYTDNCAPCVQGSMTYNLYKDVESKNKAVNSISVVSFNIINNKVNKSEYYQLHQHDKGINSKPFIYQQVIIQPKNSSLYIQNLKQYNTIGYNKNTILNNGLYRTYIRNYKSKHLDNMYWKLTKNNKIQDFNLITLIKDQNQFPLFSNTYTLIPSKSEELSGNIILNNNEIINLSGNYYNFDINTTTEVIFNTNAYLYAGKITYQKLLQNEQIIIQENTNINQQNIINQFIKEDINIINNDYYLYIQYNNQDNSGIAKIITNANTNTILRQYQYLLGPFKTLQDATNALIEYFYANDYIYQKINEINYSYERNLNV